MIDIMIVILFMSSSYVGIINTSNRPNLHACATFQEVAIVLSITNVCKFYIISTLSGPKLELNLSQDASKNNYSIHIDFVCMKEVSPARVCSTLRTTLYGTSINCKE